MPSEKEYELLRNEIMMKSNHIQNTKHILFTVTSALLAFALQAENYLPCLTPLLIILPLYLRCESQHKSIVRMAAYLYVFHEGKDFFWERRLYKYEKKYNSKVKHVDLFQYYTLVFLCGVAAIGKIHLHNQFGLLEKVLSFQVIGYTPHKYIPYIRDLFVIIVCGFVIYEIIKNQTDYTASREFYVKRWMEIEQFLIIKTEKQ